MARKKKEGLKVKCPHCGARDAQGWGWRKTPGGEFRQLMCRGCKKVFVDTSESRGGFLKGAMEDAEKKLPGLVMKEAEKIFEDSKKMHPKPKPGRPPKQAATPPPIAPKEEMPQSPGRIDRSRDRGELEFSPPSNPKDGCRFSIRSGGDAMSKIPQGFRCALVNVAVPCGGLAKAKETCPLWSGSGRVI